MDADAQMEANLAAWLAKQPPRVVPPPVLVTTPVVDDRWLTYRQAAQETHYSRRTLTQWVTDGKLDTRRTIGGGVRIRAGSLWQSETRRVGY